MTALAKKKINVPKKPIKRRGRPSVYDSEYHPHHAFKFCLLGCTDADLARSFDIHESGLHYWMETYPEFLNSIKRGREQADANVAHSLYHKAIGFRHKVLKVGITKDGDVIEHEYEERNTPDTRAAQFWLNNRQRGRWRDAPSVVVQAAGTNVAINMQPGEVSQGYLSLIESDE